MADSRATAKRGESGAASILAIGLATVLLGGCLVGIFWASVSVGRHRAASAADFAALSAAQALQTGTIDACRTASQIAAAQQAEVHACHQAGETIAVVVGVRLRLGVLGTPVVTAEARAGPTEGAN
ncbi:Rv3654c family TadE-like protein [Kribbella sp. NPDC023855]|uniref:Rv3654c family TadE-like protein n=1 Tax=Kribbella sp. NPDC023855 TaxID=3154698 RepID=UPI00340AB132